MLLGVWLFVAFLTFCCLLVVHPNFSFHSYPVLNTCHILWEIPEWHPYIASQYLFCLSWDWSLEITSAKLTIVSACLKENASKTSSYWAIIKWWIWRCRNFVSFLRLKIKRCFSGLHLLYWYLFHCHFSLL